jgi:hypothetical protein
MGLHVNNTECTVALAQGNLVPQMRLLSAKKDRTFGLAIMQPTYADLTISPINQQIALHHHNNTINNTNKTKQTPTNKTKHQHQHNKTALYRPHQNYTHQNTTATRTATLSPRNPNPHAAHQTCHQININQINITK